MAAEPKPPRDKGRKIIEKKAVALETLTIEYVSVLSITPNLYNPNRQSEHDFELLQRSMKEDGFTQPIIVQKDTNVIVDGEHRWRAAQAIGYTEVPIVRVPMDGEQMRIATLRHNRARGSEDIELTANVLRELQALGAIDWAQESAMIDDVELQNLLDDVSAPDILASDEYSEAWKPVHRADQVGGEVTSSTGQQLVGMTQQAAETIRKQEHDLSLAKSEEERAMARKESDIYRISLIFSGEEGHLVKRVLGGDPAVMLLELCKRAVLDDVATPA